jgi:hypothetical protein
MKPDDIWVRSRKRARQERTTSLLLALIAGLSTFVTLILAVRLAGLYA